MMNASIVFCKDQPRACVSLWFMLSAFLLFVNVALAASNSTALADLQRRDDFARLEVSREATQVEIRQAYLRQVRRFHPDSAPLASPQVRAEMEESFKLVKESYERLSSRGPDRVKGRDYSNPRDFGGTAESTSSARPNDKPNAGPSGTATQGQDARRDFFEALGRQAMKPAELTAPQFIDTRNASNERKYWVRRFLQTELLFYEIVRTDAREALIRAAGQKFASTPAVGQYQPSELDFYNFVLERIVAMQEQEDRFFTSNAVTDRRKIDYAQLGASVFARRGEVRRSPLSTETLKRLANVTAELMAATPISQAVIYSFDHGSFDHGPDLRPDRVSDRASDRAENAVHGRLRDASEILETWSRLQTPAAVAVINKNDFSRLSKLAHSRVIAKKAYDAFAAGAHEAPRASSRAQFCPNIF